MKHNKQSEISEIPALKVLKALFPNLGDLNGKEDILWQTANHEHLFIEFLFFGVAHNDDVGDHEQSNVHEEDYLHENSSLLPLEVDQPLNGRLRVKVVINAIRLEVLGQLEVSQTVSLLNATLLILNLIPDLFTHNQSLEIDIEVLNFMT